MFWPEFGLLSPGSLGENPCVRGVAWGLRLQPELCKGAGVGRRMELLAPWSGAYPGLAMQHLQPCVQLCRDCKRLG